MVAVLKKGLAVVAILIAFLVGTQNPQVINVNFVIASAELPLATLMSICLALGIIIGLLVTASVLSKLKWQNHRLKKSNSKLSQAAER
ncbi:LapA family protein [Pseudoalteromonas sp. CO342X]|uniref:lipopolysaccharide assembly protein LapA domain-containing protein n=1 Tax=Pseudoalteromonas sp. CO342X TaxID=1777270 RepID=UPI001022CF64|nr:LapA family protein [Pseudoalteromonas sp. CO342X]RZG16052.1 LapA family protein [Pseudoalteromonas sp. CO342X]